MWNSLVSGGDEQEDQDYLLDDTQGLCSLSPLQRIYGFCAALLAGLVLMFLALFQFCKSTNGFFEKMISADNLHSCDTKKVYFSISFSLESSRWNIFNPIYMLSLIVFVRPIKFALLFTFGNLLAVGSTAFLIGPVQQMRMMLDPVRMYATAIYIGCVVLSLICALWIHSKILTLLAILVEIGALIWYSLSYIPFARRVVSDLMIRLFDTEI